MVTQVDSAGENIVASRRGILKKKKMDHKKMDSFYLKIRDLISVREVVFFMKFS